MSEEIQAELSIELNVSCPYCGNYFDLITHEDLNEEGYITRQAVPSGDWSEPHEDFELSTNCPACKKAINIKGIAW